MLRQVSNKWTDFKTAQTLKSAASKVGCQDTDLLIQVCQRRPEAVRKLLSSPARNIYTLKFVEEVKPAVEAQGVELLSLVDYINQAQPAVEAYINR